MKISTIPYKKVRESAERNRENDGAELSEAFSWADTPEGFTFWDSVNDRNWDIARRLRPELFKESSDDLMEKFMLTALASVDSIGYGTHEAIANEAYLLAKACVERLKRGG